MIIALSEKFPNHSFSKNLVLWNTSVKNGQIFRNFFSSNFDCGNSRFFFQFLQNKQSR
jgi:hypothetical protein